MSAKILRVAKCLVDKCEMIGITSIQIEEKSIEIVVQSWIPLEDSDFNITSISSNIVIDLKMHV